MKKRIVIALLAACSLTVFTVPAVGERIVMAEEKSPEEEGLIVTSNYLVAENGVTQRVTPFFCVHRLFV